MSKYTFEFSNNRATITEKDIPYENEMHECTMDLMKGDETQKFKKEIENCNTEEEKQLVCERWHKWLIMHHNYELTLF